MSNIKIKKHYKDKYTTIDNCLVNDMSLSFKAKGVFLYFWSKPDDWEIKPKAIPDDWIDGQTAIYNALKELEKKGYLYRKRYYVNGKVAGIDYHLSDIAEFNQDLLNQENLNQAEPNEYIYIQKKDNNKRKIITKENNITKENEIDNLEEWKSFTSYQQEKIKEYLKQRKIDHGSKVKNTTKAVKPILNAILTLLNQKICIDTILSKIDKNGCVYQTIKTEYFNQLICNNYEKTTKRNNEGFSRTKQSRNVQSSSSELGSAEKVVGYTTSEPQEDLGTGSDAVKKWFIKTYGEDWNQ